MQIVIYIVSFAVMVAATLGIMSFDRRMRAGRRAAGAGALDTDSLPNFGEPDRTTLLLLTVICNLFALPYYFYATRQRASGAIIGIFFFCVVFAAMSATTIVLSVMFRVAGLLLALPLG